MPLGFEPHHPGGMVENSPAFQRRDSGEQASSPAGTAEIERLSRPSGTYPSGTANPALNRRAIIVGPSGTEKADRQGLPRTLPPSVAGPLRRTGALPLGLWNSDSRGGSPSRLKSGIIGRTMNAARFQTITEKYPQLAIAVVGDFCLDRYLEIDPSKQEISIETGLPVHNVANVRSQPGAAGTILNNLAALGIGKILPVGFAGEDGEGFELWRALESRPGVRLDYLLPT